jgi:hypothetical protein
VVVLCDDAETRNARLARVLQAAGVEWLKADGPLGDVADTKGQSVVPGITRSLEVLGLGRLELGSGTPSVPLYVVGADPFAVQRPIGDGRFVVFGSTTPFANDGLARADHAALLLDLVGERPVHVDQRLHHRRSGGLVAIARERGYGPTTLLIGVLLLVPLALLSQAPRRGDLPLRHHAAGAPAASSQVRALAALLVYSSVDGLRRQPSPVDRSQGNQRPVTQEKGSQR